MEYFEKLLPVQAEGTRNFAGDPANLPRMIYDAVCDFGGITSPFERFSLRGTELFSQEMMGSTPNQLQFLQLLLQMNGAKRVLEVGTFIGVSALMMADALPTEGRVLTIEKFDRFAEVARHNFEANDRARKIELICGDAFTVLKNLKTLSFDFIYLDGNKEKYDEYFSLLDPLLTPGGILVADDVFFNGDIFNHTPTTEKGRGTRRLLELMREQKNYHTSVLPLGNGLLLAFKKHVLPVS